MVYRIYVEKKEGFNVESNEVLHDLKENLLINGLKNVRILNRYDVVGINDSIYKKAKNTIFSEPQVDICYDESFDFNGKDKVFAVSFLPGQYDQRADSAMQCIQILTENEKPIVKTAKIYILEGEILNDEFEAIKKYIINPVEAHEVSLSKADSLDMKVNLPNKVDVLNGFINLDEKGLLEFLSKNGLAMDLEDLKFCQSYFKNDEKKDPTITEIKMIDTYWSDHCRHTTFLTSLEKIEIDNKIIQNVFDEYINSRKYVYEDRQKDICFMDIATIAAKEMKKRGYLKNLDQSDEINACSIVADVDIDGKPEKYLIMFKNETHNHPTEIEPFGGAATCLGGAIRDPLSGRSYVYQAMRITGSGDPRTKVLDTIQGKLPQRKITVKAAQGYSSYGNQIGLATGFVNEIYDEGYVAKRMEIGAVIGAAPLENVVRKTPKAGDIIILVGGKTGRDGCGGATGSSKAHTEESLESCGAEVQKGNPPEERKIQRLFRKKEVTNMIKKCNDFGAGGVSVAIGELADGLVIDLDKVSKKYEGLDGTELAISESQERMAVVVDKDDADNFIKEANLENLEATAVATVTEENRLIMKWRGDEIVNISRDFLNTNGATKKATVKVLPFTDLSNLKSCIEKDKSFKESFINCVKNLNICSQKGLVERFDSSIGKGSVLVPFGGKYALTPTESMVCKVPVLNKNTTTATVMAYGYNAQIAKKSPFHSSIYAVVEAVSKVVAVGGDYKNCYLTLQEYFERLKDDPIRYAKPFSALLGAYFAQKKLNIAAIGGKDSMSGSFNELDVPPTLVAFAVSMCNSKKVITPQFKKANSKVYLIKTPFDKNQIIDFEALKENYDFIQKAINDEKIISTYTIKLGGICEAICKMCFGNKIGFKFSKTDIDLFSADYGSFIVEAKDEINFKNAVLIGETTSDENIFINDEIIEIDELIYAFEKPLEKIFPTKTDAIMGEPKTFCFEKRNIYTAKQGFAKPKVFIPVFPGTNCEYDTQKAFEEAGAVVSQLVFRNLSSDAIKETIDEMAKIINNSQIIMLPGGFSGGDEPEGSGKFIATVFRNPKIKDAVMELLYKKDGLMLGICNGFQALIKLGLVPFGEIKDMDETCPTLTFNTIGRHISTIVNTKICSVNSPWLSQVSVGDIHSVAVSHGEGRFIANDQLIEKLAKNGQIATQYVDLNNNPTYDIKYNPNGSCHSIEGILSIDGRIFGKMGHSERAGDDIFKNVCGNYDQKIFKSGVSYYKL